MGQTGEGAEYPSPKKEDLFTRMVGHSNACLLFLCGQETKALVDTGSMVTCISETFYDSLEPKPELRALEDFKLNVYGAGGNTLPFTGYIEVERKGAAPRIFGEC